MKVWDMEGFLFAWQNSILLSDDPAKLGRPTDFTLTVKEVRLSAGAGFVVALTGEIMTMPDFQGTQRYQN